jgi:predicted nucleotidyltransferase
LIIKKIKVAFIFGSVAKSQDERASDIDIMIIGEMSFAEVSSVISTAEKQLQREVNPVVYPLDEFKLKVKYGHHFIKSVLGDEKIFLIGDDNDLEKLVE